jgi:Uma2 family endonuclease
MYVTAPVASSEVNLRRITVDEYNRMIEAGIIREDEIKGAIYARAGVPEYWIVDVDERRVEVHRDPDTSHGRYRDVRIVGAEDVVSAASVSGLTIPIRKLFE